MAESEAAAELRISRVKALDERNLVAIVTYLLARYPDAREALDAAPRLARRGGGAELRIFSEADANAEIEALNRLGGRLIAAIEPDFPAGLAVLEPPPPLISVLGQVPVLKREMVGVVGARNASALGIKFAARLAADLGNAGLVVVSGLARGIDHASHTGSLETGTVAVVAGGVDVIYPPEHKPLYNDIKSRGAIVSEMPLGMAPLSRHFPRRNRLISGMARGVVVIEAAERSGSLITANYALEQGREVFAVPGSPLDPRAKGANRLIREGAALTESADDVLAALRPMLGGSFQDPREDEQPTPPDALALEQDADRVRPLVEEKLGPSPVEIDELIRQCGAPPATVLTAILELELAGRIQRHPGNRVSWR